MAARLEAPKDPVTFVRAAARVAPERRAVFVLVGEGALLDEARAAVSSDGSPVVFAPAESDVRALLSGAAAAVLATRSEAQPLFLLEALAEGTPAVTSDLASCRDTSGNAALYVPPGDAETLAESIDMLLCDAALRGRLVTAAVDRAPRFSEERWLDGMVALYERASGRQ